MQLEAGYEDGSDVPPITLIYNTSEGHKQIAEAILKAAGLIEADYQRHGAEIGFEEASEQLKLGQLDAWWRTGLGFNVYGSLLADAMLGSTARRVVRRSVKPVMIIPLNKTEG